MTCHLQNVLWTTIRRRSRHTGLVPIAACIWRPAAGPAVKSGISPFSRPDNFQRRVPCNRRRLVRSLVNYHCWLMIRWMAGRSGPRGVELQRTMLSADSNATIPLAGASRPQARKRKGITLFTMAKVGITLLIFGFVVYSVDLSAAWKRAANLDLPVVALAGAFLLSSKVGLGGTRWLIILRCLGARPSLWETLRLFYVSAFFNTWVPGGISGDVMRAWLSSRSNIAAKTAVTSVVLDRVAALVAVAVLVLLTAPSFLARVGVSVPMLVPLVLSMVGLVGVVIAAQLERMPQRWLRFRPLRLLRELGASVRLVFLRPSTLFPLVAVAILGQTALGTATYAVAVGLGLNISFLECIVLMQPVALVANLPISIGGWGVRESAMITVFGLVGVPASASLVLSIQLGLLLLVVALPGGLLWLAMKTDRTGRAAVAARAEGPRSP